MTKTRRAWGLEAIVLEGKSIVRDGDGESVQDWRGFYSSNLGGELRHSLHTSNICPWDIYLHALVSYSLNED